MRLIVEEDLTNEGLRQRLNHKSVMSVEEQLERIYRKLSPSPYPADRCKSRTRMAVIILTEAFRIRDAR